MFIALLSRREHSECVPCCRLDFRHALLARAKRRVAARLNSRALVADSRQTDLCAYLSGILFVGLALNALFGWWWADSIAAILMVPIITREGIEALKGDACDGCH
jgi:divalent metal cation (Fe/Co/Zn/Cd) transporter